MINKVIEICLKNRFLVICSFIIMIFWGLVAIKRTPIDAIPDIGELQVIVIADWMGVSPKDIEDQVVYPLTTRLMGIPGVKAIRSTSEFSFGMINIIFKDGVDYYWARTRVLERLQVAQQFLPPGVVPVLGPDATGLGQIFWYTIENGYYCPSHPEKSYAHPGKCPVDEKPLVVSKYDLSELRSIQDWYVKYQLNSVYGVSEVASVGGYVKQYQVDINPNKLLAYNVSLHDVMDAIIRSNIDVGAQVFEEGGMEFIVRGIGFVKGVEDIENIVVAAYNGTPVYIKNVATVTIGPAFRRGVLDKAGMEVTGGVVLMRFGENPAGVINRIKERIVELERGLPSGVRIVPFYDRTELIKRCIGTLHDALIQEIIVCIFVIGVFLLHFWGSLVVILVFPLGVLFSFIIMYLIGIEANIMSLGGIAIAIGIMDDTGCVLVENIYRRLAEARIAKGGALTAKERLDVCMKGAQEVGPPVFTALMTTVIGFIPVFVLAGQAGKLFHPLAYTKTFAICGAAIIATTIMPTLAYYLLRGKLRLADENPVARVLRRIYRATLWWVLNHKAIVVIISISVLLSGIFLARKIKSEFMPPLNEGDLLFMPVLLPGASLTQVMDVIKKQDIIIKNQFPNEVEWVVGKVGRAETATDPAPVTMIETIIHLKPEKEWRKGVTREKLIKEIQEKTKIPGVSPIMTQPIRNRIDMLATGIQTPVGVKVFGHDLNKIEEIAIQIEKIVSTIPGAVAPYAERFGNRPYFEIEVDRKECARYGVKVGDVQYIIMSAIGGMDLTTTVEGKERYPIRVRYMREFRDNVSALGRIFIPTPSGAQIPLTQLAKLKKTPGPAMIASENVLYYARVFIPVDQEKTGLVDFVKMAQRAIKEKIASGEITLPTGYYIAWSGQYEAEMEARKTLSITFPICLLVILMLLYMGFKDVPSLCIVCSALPFSLAGGFILQYILGFKFSTAVWVGYISLFGVATDTAVVLIACINDLFKEKKPSTIKGIRETVLEGGLLRIRPCIMSTATTIVALIPVMFFTSAGSEVIKPMASPMIGGLVTATLINMLFIPAIYCWLKEKQLKNQ